MLHGLVSVVLDILVNYQGGIMKKIKILLLLCSLLFSSITFAQDVTQKWELKNQQTVKFYQKGNYKKGILSAEQAHQLALKNFGQRDSKTLTSISVSAIYN